MRNVTNMTTEDATKSGWKVLKDIEAEVIGKAILIDNTLTIMKSTKRFAVPGGWIYNITTEINRGGAISVAEAATFVPTPKETSYDSRR